MNKLAIFIAALFIFCAGAFAQELPRIAVYVTGNVGEDEKKALGTRMLVSLINSKRYKGIERSNSFLAEVEKEQVKQRSGEIDDSQIRELGKQFGVQFVCIADITPAYGSFQVSARIVNVETAEVDFIGDATSPLKTIDDLTLVSGQVVNNMFGEQITPEPKTEPAAQEPPPAAVSQAKTEKPKPEPKPKPEAKPKPEPKPNIEPIEVNESKYRSMQKKISFEMGGAFVPYSYYNRNDSEEGFSIGGGGYIRIDFIYVEIILPDIVLVNPHGGEGSGMGGVILKCPIVYEMIKVSPIVGGGGLGTGHVMSPGFIFGGKIDVAVSEIAYLRSEYLYNVNEDFSSGLGGGITSFKIGGGLDIGLGERKKTYLRGELLYNYMGGYETKKNSEYKVKETMHYVDLRAGIGYKWGSNKPK